MIKRATKKCNLFGDFATKRVNYRCRASYHLRKKPCNLFWLKTGSNVDGNGKQYCKTSCHFLLPFYWSFRDWRDKRKRFSFAKDKPGQKEKQNIKLGCNRLALDWRIFNLNFIKFLNYNTDIITVFSGLNFRLEFGRLW